MTTVEGSAEDRTELDRSALRELLQPVRARIRVAQLLQVIASVNFRRRLHSLQAFRG